jgi:cell division protein FtsA
MADTLTALDIGTTKVSCVIAEYDARAHKFHVIGTGFHACRGVKKGLITNMDETENAILNAVHMAEKMASTTIQDVVVNISGKHLLSELLSLSAPLPNQVVTDDDINALIQRASYVEAQNNFDVIHAFPLQYTLDTTQGIKDPRGMMGRSLTAKMHVVTADQQVLKNLLHCVHRCHLNVRSVISSSIASGYATLTEDEMEMGVTLIDIGGDTTEISIFFEGNVIHTLSIPLGGLHITNDIAHGFNTTLPQAERLKTVYGSALETGDDDKVLMTFSRQGDEKAESRTVKKKYLTQVIKPRIEEMFDVIKTRLESSNMYKIAGRRIVLTGGCSQLSSIKIMAAQILGKQVRLGHPLKVKGDPEIISSPSLSTAAGLLDFAYQDWYHRRTSTQHTSAWASMMAWVKENF